MHLVVAQLKKKKKLIGKYWRAFFTICWNQLDLQADHWLEISASLNIYNTFENTNEDFKCIWYTVTNVNWFPVVRLPVPRSLLKHMCKAKKPPTYLKKDKFFLRKKTNNKRWYIQVEGKGRSVADGWVPCCSGFGLLSKHIATVCS